MVLKTALIANNLGFTLLEVMLAVSILIALSAASLPYFSSFIVNLNLRTASESVQIGLRDAQNKALSGEDSTISCGAIPQSQCNKYWAAKFTNNADYFQLGRVVTSNAIPTAEDCTNLTIMSNSPALSGGAYFNVGSPACVFYRMITSEAYFVGGTSDIRFQTSASVYRCVFANSEGLIKGDDGCAGY